MLLGILMLILPLAISGCGNSPAQDMSATLVGTWELSETNMPEITSDTVVFRNDGTGTMALGALRDNFEWSIDDDNNLVLVQGGGLFIVAYTITELNNSTLSYEADIPGIGFIQVTFTRR